MRARPARLQGPEISLIGEVVVPTPSAGDFELTFTKGPGVNLIVIRTDPLLLSAEGPLARVPWAGPLDSRRRGPRLAWFAPEISSQAARRIVRVRTARKLSCCVFEGGPVTRLFCMRFRDNRLSCYGTARPCWERGPAREPVRFWCVFAARHRSPQFLPTGFDSVEGLKIYNSEFAQTCD